jgi:beta-lactamase class A
MILKVLLGGIARRPLFLACCLVGLQIAFTSGGEGRAAPLTVKPGPFAELQAKLQVAVEGSGLDVTVAVTDLQTGETISVRGDQPRLAACSINLLVLIQATLDMSTGLIPVNVGDDLVRRTVHSSNPVTARELLFLVGAGDLGAGMKKVNDLGDRLRIEIRYDHPPAFIEESLTGLENAVTANDMNALLAALWNQQILTPEWTDYLLQKLTGVKPGLQYLIPAGVGNAAVSHKNGFVWTAFGWIDNDVGIVSFNAGGQTYAYAISYFASWVPNEYGDITLGQRISSLVWSYFESLYGSH